MIPIFYMKEQGQRGCCPFPLHPKSPPTRPPLRSGQILLDHSEHLLHNLHASVASLRLLFTFAPECRSPSLRNRCSPSPEYPVEYATICPTTFSTLEEDSETARLVLRRITINKTILARSCVTAEGRVALMSHNARREDSWRKILVPYRQVRRRRSVVRSRVFTAGALAIGGFVRSRGRGELWVLHGRFAICSWSGQVRRGCK
jgi:hypothetical protein